MYCLATKHTKKRIRYQHQAVQTWAYAVCTRRQLLLHKAHSTGRHASGSALHEVSVTIDMQPQHQLLYSYKPVVQYCSYAIHRTQYNQPS